MVSPASGQPRRQASPLPALIHSESTEPLSQHWLLPSPVCPFMADLSVGTVRFRWSIASPILSPANPHPDFLLRFLRAKPFAFSQRLVEAPGSREESTLVASAASKFVRAEA